MAHVQKFTSGSASRILGHCEREKSEYGNFLKYRSGSDIDPTKTHLNMSMKFQDGLTPQERLQKRLSEVHVLKRKDVNVMCDWVLTLPKELPQDLDTIKVFFYEAANFLMNRYGKENAVSCTVHLDEAQPHMHFCFVPVTYDTKKEYYKVSAKEVLTRTELNRFHTDLETYLQKTIGLEKGLIYSGVTKKQGGNKTIGQLKAETLETAAQKTAAEVQTFEEKVNAAIEGIKQSDDWKTVQNHVFQLKNYQVPVAHWFDGRNIKIKKGKIIMPVEELDFIFKAVSCLQAQNTIQETQKALKSEIRALYDYDPEELNRRYTEALEKEHKAKVLYEKQISLNQRADRLEKNNNRLQEENDQLKENLKGFQILREAYDNLLPRLEKKNQAVIQLKKQLAQYEKMFTAFPELTTELKNRYQKLVKDRRQQEKSSLESDYEKER